ADCGDISNIFRFDRDTGRVFQITDVHTGVSGVTRLSPALSIAATSGSLAYSVFSRGGYEIHTIDRGADLDGQELPALSVTGTPAAGPIDDNLPVPQVPAIVDPRRAA